MAEPSGDDVASTATIEAPIPDVQPDAVDAGVVIDSMTDVKAPTNSTDAKEAAEVAEVATDATPDEAAPEPAPPVEASEDVDAELEAMKKRLQQMEQETMAMDPADEAAGADGAGAAKAAGDNAENGAPDAGAPAGQDEAGPDGFPPSSPIDEATADSDARSIYVGNVDYKATGEELNQYFQECGTINRVTIMCHKATGQPKGFAYIEFKERDSVQNAVILNDSLFRGRQLKVIEKRTNVPGLNRGGFGRGRPRFTRGWRGGYGRRPRGRGRGRGRWAPY